MQFVLTALLACFCAAALPQVLASHDDIMDNYFQQVRSALVVKNITVYDLPTADTFYTNNYIGETKMSGHISTGAGILRNVSTFARAGHAKVEIIDMNQITTTVSIYTDAPLTVDFPNFYFNLTEPMIFINNKGVRFDIHRSVIELELHFFKQGTACNVTVAGAHLASLGHISAHIQPQSFWQQGESDLAERYLEALHEEVRQILDKSVQGLVQRIANFAGVCLSINF